MNYTVAIASLGRPESFKDKTYNLLKQSSLLSKSAVFVIAEEEELYKSICPHIKVIVGKKGLMEQREFIYNYYKPGTLLLSLDDDVEYLLDISKTKIYDIRPYAEKGFHEMLETGCRLWSIYPVANPFFMSDKPSTNLRFCIGCFFGYLKARDYLKDLSAPPEIVHKEDLLRTLLYFNRDGGVYRLNHVAPVTKYQVSGGLSGNVEGHEIAANYLVDTYPNICKKFYRKNNMPEVRLLKNKL